MEEHTVFSIIIPTRKISEYLIAETLPALEKQTFRLFEVIFLPTHVKKKDRDLEKKYSWLRIRATPRVELPAEKRNIGVKEARGDIIAFIDDDAFPPQQWLKQAYGFFKRKNVIALCGPGILPPSSTFWESVFDQALQTALGSGLYTYRFMSEDARYVDDYPSMNFFIDKNLFQKIGGFKENHWPGEDSKLCNDIVYGEKKTIRYSPKLAIFHHRRTHPVDFLKQHANYGLHRGAFFIHGDQNSKKIVYLIPTFFTLYLILLGILFLFESPKNISSFLLLPFYAYAIAQTYVFFRSFFSTENIFIPFGTTLAIFFMHIVYGVSFGYGLIREFFFSKALWKEEDLAK